MVIVAGIDEAGYGPMFGPLVIGRMVMAVAGHAPALADEPLPDFWSLLGDGVCREVRGARGRVAVNDSKKLYSPDKGLRHLETAALVFDRLRQTNAARPGPGQTAAGDQLGDWLTRMGNRDPADLKEMPWYAADDARPWDTLPVAITADELALAAGMVGRSAARAGVRALDAAASVVFEERFNHMVAATHSKAAVSFTFVAAHLRAIWDRWSDQAPGPRVIVDRQGGRSHYRELLAMTFPEASLRIEEESPTRSAYRLTRSPDRRMRVSFEVDSESRSMPTALASILSKYTRELLMARLARWFGERLPEVRPTAGYGSDAKRFWEEVRPHLSRLGVNPAVLRRTA